MEVSLIDHMGSDLSVVNAARVSFAKKHDEFDNQKDSRLIRYLAKHGHWTPFGHTSVTLHLKAPIFLARQLGKHQVGLVWNEVSRRYVDSMPEFYVPDMWRSRPENSIKQGSGEDFFTEAIVGSRDHNEFCLDYYMDLISSGIAPEQARMVLPQSMMTEWYWTGSIAAFSRVYTLRIDNNSQKEAQEIAKKIDSVIRPHFPVSWSALTKT